MNYIGLDVGTTGAKALLVDERGKVLGKGYAGYKLVSDGCRVEQRADDWTECGASAIRQALKNHDASKVAAISLSTQGSSVVALDSCKRPIANALTWMDTRAKAEAAELTEKLGDEYIYRNTGWRCNPALDAAKIAHMKRSSDFSGSVCFLSTLEYVNLFLTGNPVCDPSNSSIRQLYNVSRGDYDDRILDAAGITRDELAIVQPTGSLVGHITEPAAAATGLPAGTPVFNGAHDQYCASIGAACVEKGDLLLSAGTTWVVMGIDDMPLFTGTNIAPAVHPIPGLYGAIASLVGSGTSLQWFKDNFTDADFDGINRQVSTRSDDGLFFYPYLSGAFYPVWKQNARGAFTGICLEHDKYDFARAIMEAMAFSVRRTLDDFVANGFAAKTLRIMGGAAKSGVWCSLIAAALGMDVEISDETEACALGAAIIAASGSLSYKTLPDAVKAMASGARRLAPDPALCEVLNEKYSRYQRMWECISRYY